MPDSTFRFHFLAFCFLFFKKKIFFAWIVFLLNVYLTRQQVTSNTSHVALSYSFYHLLLLFVHSSLRSFPNFFFIILFPLFSMSHSRRSTRTNKGTGGAVSQLERVGQQVAATHKRTRKLHDFPEDDDSDPPAPKRSKVVYLF